MLIFTETKYKKMKYFQRIQTKVKEQNPLRKLSESEVNPKKKSKRNPHKCQ